MNNCVNSKRNGIPLREPELVRCKNLSFTRSLHASQPCTSPLRDNKQEKYLHLLSESNTKIRLFAYTVHKGRSNEVGVGFQFACLLV